MTPLELKDIDAILGLQLTVAWAGERSVEPQRLNWWNTDLTDQEAGGDLFARIRPRTTYWAGLEMATEAAFRTSIAARSRLAEADQTCTLFHFGFLIDEAIQDRFEHHKRHSHVPTEVFSATWGIRPSWDKEALETFLSGLGPASWKESPAGREVTGGASDLSATARALAAALLPLAAQYPLPYTNSTEAR